MKFVFLDLFVINFVMFQRSHLEIYSDKNSKIKRSLFLDILADNADNFIASVQVSLYGVCCKTFCVLCALQRHEIQSLPLHMCISYYILQSWDFPCLSVL